MRRLRTLLAVALFAAAALPLKGDSAVVDGPSHNGVEAIVDLPKEQHVKNFGAPRDGMGLCVFASMDMMARWQHCRPLIDIIHKIPNGGGWPEKVDRVVKEHGQGVEIVQYQGADPAFLDLAMKTRRAVGVTYGYGERYGMQKIAHMVMLVHLDDKTAAILDNNFPGTLEWMSRDEFLKRWKYPSGSGWGYVIIEPPPPPIPSN